MPSENMRKIAADAIVELERLRAKAVERLAGRSSKEAKDPADRAFLRANEEIIEQADADIIQKMKIVNAP